MKFTIPTTTTTTRGVIIGRPDGTRVDCEQATPDEQRGALRAIAEHLGPEETIASLGTDAHAKQFADAQTREAIRAAGYDPDQVGAAEVIGDIKLSLGHARQQWQELYAVKRESWASYVGAAAQLEASEKREHIIQDHRERECARARKAETYLDTARAQLREWRETVGRALNQLALNADPKERVAAAVEILAPLTVSAIPDEQQGPVEPMVPAGERDRWRARAHDTIAGDTDFTGSIKGIANERDRLREKLKNSVNTVARAAGEIEALRDERGTAVVQARATRAETAVEAMRGVVEGAEGVAHCGPRTPDETWEPLQLRLVQAAILHGPAALAALADYDATPDEEEKSQRLDNDCLRCAVATVLGIPYSDVPHFTERGGKYCIEDLVMWGAARGLTVEVTDTDPAERCVAFGDSSRGERHAVVWNNGLQWDPHPSREGLSGAPEYFAVFTEVLDANALAEPTDEQPQARVGALEDVAAAARRWLRLWVSEGDEGRRADMADEPEWPAVEEALVNAIDTLDKIEGATRAGKDGDADARREPNVDSVEESPPPARVVGGGKLEPLELRCSDVPARDWIRLYAISRIAVRVAARDGDRNTSINLDRESVRRAVDWMTAWLGGKRADRATLRHWLYRHTPSTQTRFDMDEVIGLLAQLVYEWPVVVERDGAETKGEKSWV